MNIDTGSGDNQAKVPFYARVDFSQTRLTAPVTSASRSSPQDLSNSTFQFHGHSKALPVIDQRGLPEKGVSDNVQERKWHCERIKEWQEGGIGSCFHFEAKSVILHQSPDTFFIMKSECSCSSLLLKPIFWCFCCSPPRKFPSLSKFPNSDLYKWSASLTHYLIRILFPSYPYRINSTESDETCPFKTVKSGDELFVLKMKIVNHPT